MRDRETIDSELRRLAAGRRSTHEPGGELSSRRIDELLDDPEKRTRFGINGYSRTAALYSEKMYFQRLHALYKQVMDNGKANAYRLPGLARRPV